MHHPLISLAVLAQRKLHKDDCACRVARFFIHGIAEHELAAMVSRILRTMASPKPVPFARVVT